MAKKSRNAHMANESKMVKNLDTLIAYEEYTQQVLPKLQRAVTERWAPEKIYKEFGALIAAKVVTTALLEEDSGKSLAASKEILDRALGKPKERVESTHKYEKLNDNDLDNLLASTLQSMESEDDETKLQ